MKQTRPYFLNRLIAPVFAGAALLSACNNDDTVPTYTTGNTSGVEAAHDSAAHEHDQQVVGQGADSSAAIAIPGDSTAQGSASQGSPTQGAATQGSASETKSIGDTTSKGARAAQRKKGHVSIATPPAKRSGAMEMDKEGYYSYTEVLPSFPGGARALERFFEDNLQYPDAASDNGTEGTVTLMFNVDETGKIGRPQTAGQRIGDGLEEEAIRVFNRMPAWTPGKIKGKNVKTRFSLPVTFRLD